MGSVIADIERIYKQQSGKPLARHSTTEVVERLNQCTEAELDRYWKSIWPYIAEFDFYRAMIPLVKNPALMKKITEFCFSDVYELEMFLTEMPRVPPEVASVVVDVVKQKRGATRVTFLGRVQFLECIAGMESFSSNIKLLSDLADLSNFIHCMSERSLDEIIQHVNDLELECKIALINHPGIFRYGGLSMEILLDYLSKCSFYPLSRNLKHKFPLVEVDYYSIGGLDMRELMTLLELSVDVESDSFIRFTFSSDAISYIRMKLTSYLIANRNLLQRYPCIRKFLNCQTG